MMAQSSIGIAELIFSIGHFKIEDDFHSFFSIIFDYNDPDSRFVEDDATGVISIKFIKTFDMFHFTVWNRIPSLEEPYSQPWLSKNAILTVVVEAVIDIATGQVTSKGNTMCSDESCIDGVVRLTDWRLHAERVNINRRRKE